MRGEMPGFDGSADVLSAPQAGTATVTFSGSTSGTGTVTFAHPFPAVPKVLVIQNGTDARMVLAVSGNSTTGCTVSATFPVSLSAAVPVDWIAMLPTQ